jgi:hypothetical protein
LIEGCSHTTVTRTVVDALSNTGSHLDHLQLNPQYRYLRVTVNQKSALLVLGYTEEHQNGPIEIWYSDSGQVLRLQNGRVIGTLGLETDWLNVNYNPLPSWQEIAQYSPIPYQRKRDQMPGYRFGILESLSISPIPAPAKSEIVPIPGKELRWYEEVNSNHPDLSLPSRYAVIETDGGYLVMYGDQCLSSRFCLSWQVWPAK